jgi:hypothetical protein
MMRKSAAALIGILLLTASAFAQNTGGGTNPNPANPNDPNNPNSNEPSDKEVRNGYWEANLAGGNYLVALGRISSVSRHKYVLDGTLIVDEVTVDTTGQALARFYFITPITATGVGAAASDAAERALALVDGAARRSGTDVQDMVVKKYPLTTHSKAIEYRLLSEQQLGSLYQSVKTAWVTGKGRVFTSR